MGESDLSIHKESKQCLLLPCVMQLVDSLIANRFDHSLFSNTFKAYLDVQNEFISRVRLQLLCSFIVFKGSVFLFNKWVDKKSSPSLILGLSI